MKLPGGNDARARDDDSTTGTDTDSRHRTEDSATGTSTGAGVTSRMAGTHEPDSRDVAHGKHESTVHQSERYEERARILPAKTSAAATFALVFGLAALFSALTAILAPLGVLFGVIGLVLGFAGLKMAKRAGVTGKGVAVGGLITALLGLLLGGAVLAGAAVVVNDEAQLDRVSNWIEDVRNDIPSADRIQNQLSN